MSKYFLPKRKTKRNLNMKHFLSNFALCFCHQYRKCLRGRQGFSWTFLFCASCGQLKIQCQIMFRKLLKRQGQQEITSNFTQVVENHPLHLYYCYLSESPGFFLGTGSFIVKSKLITIIVGQSPNALVQGWSQIKQSVPSDTSANLFPELVWLGCELGACRAGHAVGPVCYERKAQSGQN